MCNTHIAKLCLIQDNFSTHYLTCLILVIKHTIEISLDFIN